ncbi:MAG: hypothetical protein PUD16_04035 [bacterium]|nr:hypothetical protein [bacterium]
MPKERSLFAEAGLDPEVPPQTWDEEVIRHVYGIADYIALHQYYGGQQMGTAAFLAQSEDFERYVDTIRSANHARGVVLTAGCKQTNQHDHSAVAPQEGDAVLAGNELVMRLPPMAFGMVRVAV